MAWAADLLLVAHTLFVVFVTGGFALIWIGHWRGWAWVGNACFRALHLIAITVVALEALAGLSCPLTLWEDALRGQDTSRSFVARSLHVVIYYDFPEWVFTVAYVAFAAATAVTIRLVPTASAPRPTRR
jgi:hypothetical protein